MQLRRNEAPGQVFFIAESAACVRTFGGVSLRKLWWRRPLAMNSRRIQKFDWPRVTLLSGGGLHYGQESFGGEICTWMKK